VVAADLVGLAAAVVDLEIVVEAEGEPVTRGVLELETEDVVVLEICPVLEGDGWAVGEREKGGEAVGETIVVADTLDESDGCAETDTEAEADTEMAGLAEADGQGEAVAEGAADSDTELRGLKEAEGAAVADRLCVVEAVIESWAVWVAVSVGFTVDV
jgi:hypothetical protein